MRRLMMVLALAGCVDETGPETVIVAPMMESYDTPDGKPPVMGTATFVEGGAEKVLSTIDFSIGAFDASAWFEHMEESMPVFHLTAWPNADSEAKGGILTMEASFGAKVGAGSHSTSAKVAELIGTDRSGRRWTSEASGSASVVIDSFKPDTPGSSSGYGHATGHYTAHICSGDGDPVRYSPSPRCRDVSGDFDTNVQYEP